MCNSYNDIANINNEHYIKCLKRIICDIKMDASSMNEKV